MALTTPTNDLTGNTIATTYDQILFIDGAAITNSALFAVACQDGETALHVANDQILIKDSSGTDIASCFEVQDKDGTVCLSVNGTNNRVGIGTDSPDTKLEVAGSFAANGASSTFVTFSDGDATPSVATGNIFKHHASTQTINMFDDGVCGQIITVISTAAITYDFNASNLKCGSADIVTASGDVTMWVFDGTNWYLISWMDVSANLADGSAGGF